MHVVCVLQFGTAVFIHLEEEENRPGSMPAVVLCFCQKDNVP